MSTLFDTAKKHIFEKFIWHRKLGLVDGKDLAKWNHEAGYRYAGNHIYLDKTEPTTQLVVEMTKYPDPQLVSFVAIKGFKPYAVEHCDHHKADFDYDQCIMNISQKIDDTWRWKRTSQRKGSHLPRSKEEDDVASLHGL
jgi:hypothetical protein